MIDPAALATADRPAIFGKRGVTHANAAGAATPHTSRNKKSAVAKIAVVPTLVAAAGALLVVAAGIQFSTGRGTTSAADHKLSGSSVQRSETSTQGCLLAALQRAADLAALCPH